MEETVIPFTPTRCLLSLRMLLWDTSRARFALDRIPWFKWLSTRATRYVTADQNVRYEKMKPRRWSLWTTTNGRYLVSIQRGQELTPQTICRRYFCPRFCCLSIRLTLLNKAPRLSIKIDVWILLYDTVFVKLNQLIHK